MPQMFYLCLSSVYPEEHLCMRVIFKENEKISPSKCFNYNKPLEISHFSDHYLRSHIIKLNPMYT